MNYSRRIRKALGTTLIITAIGVPTAAATYCTPSSYLTVAATASASYETTHAWDVVKSADAVKITTDKDTAVVNYTVQATKSAGVSGNHRVTGTVKVSNGSYSSVTGVTVTGDMPHIAGESCAISAGVNQTIPARSSKTFDYVCTLTEKADSKFAAKVTQGSVAKYAYAWYTFGSAVVKGGSADVTDAFDGAAASVLGAGLTASKTFTYPRTITVPASGCKTYVNVAKVTPKDSGAPKSDDAAVEVCRTTPPPVAPPPVDPPKNPPATPPTPPPPATPPVEPPVTPPPATPPATPPPATPPATPPSAPPVELPAALPQLPAAVAAAAAPARPGLAVVKSGPRAAVAGQVVTYTITVRNTGKAAASGVVLRDVMPGGFTLARKAAGGTLRGGAVTWRIASLAPGASRTVKATFRLDRTVSGRRCNVALASATGVASVRSTACTRIAAVAGAITPAVTG